MRDFLRLLGYINELKGFELKFTIKVFFLFSLPFNSIITVFFKHKKFLKISLCSIKKSFGRVAFGVFSEISLSLLVLVFNWVYSLFIFLTFSSSFSFDFFPIFSNNFSNCCFKLLMDFD